MSRASLHETDSHCHAVSQCSPARPLAILPVPQSTCSLADPLSFEDLKAAAFWDESSKLPG